MPQYLSEICIKYCMCCLKGQYNYPDIPLTTVTDIWYLRTFELIDNFLAGSQNSQLAIAFQYD